jgi:hypothetical protein
LLIRVSVFSFVYAFDTAFYRFGGIAVIMLAMVSDHKCFKSNGLKNSLICEGERLCKIRRRFMTSPDGKIPQK